MTEEAPKKKSSFNSPGAVFLVIVLVVFGGLFALDNLYNKVKVAQYNIAKAEEYDAEKAEVSRIIEVYQENFAKAKEKASTLDIALPKDGVRFTDIITQIESVSAKEGVILSSVSVSEGSGGSDQSTSSVPVAPAPVEPAMDDTSPEAMDDYSMTGGVGMGSAMGPSDYEIAEISLGIVVQPDNFLNFLGALERNLRLVDIISFSMGNDSDSENSSSEPEDENMGQDIELSAKVYYLPDVKPVMSDDMFMGDPTMGAGPEAGVGP